MMVGELYNPLLLFSVSASQHFGVSVCSFAARLRSQKQAGMLLR